jgi:TolB-like protein/Tfp pilus assembly protein PilF/tRNA A-37 threonylcarbamoyl transferase component Bud32
MVGKTISHYKILQKLGSGGMGVVYKAQDTKLKRTVAVKFLPAELDRDTKAKERFIREAQAASALDHPNICTIYEINEVEGRTFIAMAYVEGQSLRDMIESGPLKLDEALDIAVQVAEGLQEAHEKGIVHRDINSANIMLTPKGQAKIMDFGLALLAGSRQSTQIDAILGTMPYMSPEQAQGGEVDHRTDIWSLGVVLYQMVSGHLPFKGEYEQAVAYSILNEEPEPLTGLRTDAPEELERIVNKALAKDPSVRYQKVGDILFDVKWAKKELDSQARRDLPSVVVLPFVNLSTDREQDFFCEGMAGGIINALTHVEGLRVAGWSSASSFRGKQVDLREIGRKLRVKTLLEGSVRKLGNKLRIMVQLINIADGFHIWSEAFDRDISELCCPEDVFVIQDEIALAIVNKLRVKLLGGEKAKIVKRYTESLEAYDSYIRGRFFWNKRTEAGLKRAIEYFEQAIEKDPNYALAYAGLADSYLLLQDYSSISPKELYPQANGAIKRALEIDGTLAEVHTSLAQIEFRSWNWEDSEREYKKAIELNPNYSTAHHWYALYLMYTARFDEAIEEIRQAQELDPLSLVISRNDALVLYYSRRYDQAVEKLKKTLEMEPSFSAAHAYLGRAYLQKSMYQEALQELQRERDISGRSDPLVETWKGVAYQGLGREFEAKQVLENLLKQTQKGYVPPIALANLYFALGGKKEGFQWLNKAYRQRDSTLLEIKVDPGFDSVRSDKRFITLLKKMGLEK